GRQLGTALKCPRGGFDCQADFLVRLKPPRLPADDVSLEARPKNDVLPVLKDLGSELDCPLASLRPRAIQLANRAHEIGSRLRRKLANKNTLGVEREDIDPHFAVVAKESCEHCPN